jgi:hypothetical protein
VPRAPLYAVVALLTAVVLPSAGAAPKGEERVLVVLASAGSKPFPVAAVQRTIGEADGFFRSSSFGQVRLSVDVTPWLTAFSGSPGCGGATTRTLEAVVAPARLAADHAGYKADLYDEVIYTLADSHCGFLGATWGHEVMLTREPTVQLVVHELGHAFGLGHAQASDCTTSPLRCAVDDTGDTLSPMGSGFVDFSAYEKAILGWIPPQPHVTSPRRYELAPPTFRSKLAQALVVETKQGSWWLEYRSQPFRGLVFRFVDNTTAPSPFAPSAVLMLKPAKAGRPWIVRGESYRIPFSYRVTLTRAGSTRAEVRFRP